MNTRQRHRYCSSTVRLCARGRGIGAIAQNEWTRASALRLFLFLFLQVIFSIVHDGPQAFF
jgi:hypothetical protein